MEEPASELWRNAMIFNLNTVFPFGVSTSLSLGQFKTPNGRPVFRQQFIGILRNSEAGFLHLKRFTGDPQLRHVLEKDLL